MKRLGAAAERGRGGRDGALHREVKLAPHAQVAQAAASMRQMLHVTELWLQVARHTSPEADDKGRAGGCVERVYVGGGRSGEQLRPHAGAAGDSCILE